MEVFAGPQLTPPRVSLISSADAVTSPNDNHWESGFIAETDGCDTVSTFKVCPPESASKDITASGGSISYKPYVLYATDKCSTYGSEDRDFYGRAQRKLLSGESAALERILWDGNPDELNLNPFLSDGAGDYNSTSTSGLSSAAATQTIVTAVNDPELALAILEQAMSDCSSARGMIHLRPQALHQLITKRVVHREGNVWLSPLDNIVVPGRGYPGTGPTGQAVGATEWMYGHPGIVQIRRGEVVRVGENDKASQVNRGWNDREVIVERVAHVALDPSCCVFAIQIDSLGTYTLS